MRTGLCFLLVLSCTLLGGQDYQIYVSDAGNFDKPPWQILRFDSAGKAPEVFISDRLAWPQDILFQEAEGTVLISNLSSGEINAHDAETGAFLRTVADSIAGPTRMKIGPDSMLYVLQWAGDGKVLRMHPDGSDPAPFTTTGVPRSIGLDWDAEGRLYVSSFSRREVTRFDRGGAVDSVVIDSSALLGPTNVLFEEDGNLLVFDYRGGVVKRFDPDGRPLGIYVEGLNQPEGIDRLPDGNFLIGNGGDGSVRMISASGEQLGEVVITGMGGLKTPNAVRVRYVR